MFGLILTLAITTSSACPMMIGISGDGTLFSNRFDGWYRISSRTLESDLRGGCYNDANPLPVTSVELLIAPDAPKLRVETIFSLLKKHGWRREKIKSGSWGEVPQAPRRGH